MKGVNYGSQCRIKANEVKANGSDDVDHAVGMKGDVETGQEKAGKEKDSQGEEQGSVTSIFECAALFLLLPEVHLVD